jgi:hypothetical protein
MKRMNWIFFANIPSGHDLMRHFMLNFLLGSSETIVPETLPPIKLNALLTSFFRVVLSL